MLVQKEAGFVLPARHHDLLIFGFRAENHLAFVEGIFPPIHQGLGLNCEYGQHSRNQDALDDESCPVSGRYLGPHGEKNGRTGGNVEGAGEE